MKNITTYLIPYTGTLGAHRKPMKCEFFEDHFSITFLKEALIDLDAGRSYKIPYKCIERIIDKNSAGSKGARIYLNDKTINFPISPPAAASIFGSLIGTLLTLKNKDKFILYFKDEKCRQIFIDTINFKLGKNVYDENN